jgi:hypothetical protein
MENKIIYYVYELIDPRNNLPFYTGKGKEERMYLHVKKVKNNSMHNKNKRDVKLMNEKEN